MYKLMVVDDEPRQVKALANIISQLRPGYEIFTAGDGQEALDFIFQNQIDLLMTDIRMPNMDGLELIEKLSEKGHKIKIVILSGYGEFEYAQKAIRFGVKDYLVKPISKKDLEDLLSKIDNNIKEDQEQIQHQESLKKKLDSSLPVYIEHQLNKWVSGSLNGKDIAEIASIFPFKGFGAVVITDFSKFHQFLENIDIEGANKVLQHGKYLIKETLNVLGHSISFYLEGHRNVMVTILNTNQQFNLLSYDQMKGFSEFINTIRNEYGITATLGISEKSENIFEDITKCFKEALFAIEKKFYLGLGKIIHYSDSKWFDASRTLNLRALEVELSETVRRMDKSSVIKIIGTAFDNVNENSYIDPQRFKEEWLHLVLNQIKVLYPMMDEEEFNSYIKEIKCKIVQCEEYRELRHGVNNILSEVIDLLGHKGRDKNSIIIGKCKKYIDDNYMKDVSLESVAQKFYFNPSYFSNLFKNSTGSGFSEYLLQIRIQNAQNLLKNTDVSIANVAIKVGFNDPTYFNRVFKRQTGLSPLKYRQMNGQ